MSYLQQGDLILTKIEKPTNVEKLKTDVLYKGQNHEHKLRGKFCIAKDSKNTYIHSKGCELYHDEHAMIKIPDGFYELKIVLEYDHWLEESRQVID
jgi:hypothetical protein